MMYWCVGQLDYVEFKDVLRVAHVDHHLIYSRAYINDEWLVFYKWKRTAERLAVTPTFKTRAMVASTTPRRRSASSVSRSSTSRPHNKKNLMKKNEPNLQNIPLRTGLGAELRKVFTEPVIDAGLMPKTRARVGATTNSIALVASNNGIGCVLERHGSGIDADFEGEGSPELALHNLDEAPDGISIWEGTFHTWEVNTPDAHEFESELRGKFRDLTPAEWANLQRLGRPWLYVLDARLLGCLEHDDCQLPENEELSKLCAAAPPAPKPPETHDDSQASTRR